MKSISIFILFDLYLHCKICFFKKERKLVVVHMFMLQYVVIVCIYVVIVHVYVLLLLLLLLYDARVFF